MSSLNNIFKEDKQFKNTVMKDFNNFFYNITKLSYEELYIFFEDNYNNKTLLLYIKEHLEKYKNNDEQFITECKKLKDTLLDSFLNSLDEEDLFENEDIIVNRIILYINRLLDKTIIDKEEYQRIIDEIKKIKQFVNLKNTKMETYSYLIETIVRKYKYNKLYTSEDIDRIIEILNLISEDTLIFKDNEGSFIQFLLLGNKIDTLKKAIDLGYKIKLSYIKEIIDYINGEYADYKEVINFLLEYSEKYYNYNMKVQLLSYLTDKQIEDNLDYLIRNNIDINDLIIWATKNNNLKLVSSLVSNPLFKIEIKDKELINCFSDMFSSNHTGIDTNLKAIDLYNILNLFLITAYKDNIINKQELKEIISNIIISNKFSYIKDNVDLLNAFLNIYKDIYDNIFYQNDIIAGKIVLKDFFKISRLYVDDSKDKTKFKNIIKNILNTDFYPSIISMLNIEDNLIHDNKNMLNIIGIEFNNSMYKEKIEQLFENYNFKINYNMIRLNDIFDYIYNLCKALNVKVVGNTAGDVYKAIESNISNKKLLQLFEILDLKKGYNNIVTYLDVVRIMKDNDILDNIKNIVNIRLKEEYKKILNTIVDDLKSDIYYMDMFAILEFFDYLIDNINIDVNDLIVLLDSIDIKSNGKYKDKITDFKVKVLEKINEKKIVYKEKNNEFDFEL